MLLYRQLLARYGCDQWQDGPDAHFTQGAVQLALAHHADEFLPELIGLAATRLYADLFSR